MNAVLKAEEIAIEAAAPLESVLRSARQSCDVAARAKFKDA